MFRILSLDGGGIKGAFTASVEAALEDVQGPGAEIAAAGAAGLILGVGDFQPGDAAVGQGAEAAAENAFAMAPSAAGGARGAFGGGSGCG